MSDKIKLGLVAGLLILYFGITLLMPDQNRAEEYLVAETLDTLPSPADIDSLVYWFDGENEWVVFAADTIMLDSLDLEAINRVPTTQPTRRMRIKIQPVGSEQ